VKIYIMTDMEGITRVDSHEMGDPRNKRLHKKACSLLAGDINAAIKGALEAGATEIVVCDGHAGGGNLRPENLIEPAKLVLPRGSQDYLPDIDESFDACFIIGGHAMDGAADACLAHTQSLLDWEEFSVNGRPTGEIGQVAMIAGHFGVPVTLVTGDRAAVEEATSLLGEGIESVCVKEMTGGVLHCLPPDRTSEMIKAAARKAAQRAGDAAALKIDLPAQIALRCKSPEFARRVAAISGAELVNEIEVRFVADAANKVAGRLFDHNLWKNPPWRRGNR